MSKARIMIVEDELPVARMIAISLAKLGHEVVGTTAFSHESIDLAERLHPDLVLMDIDLSDGSSGVEAAQLLRRNFAIPSVFLTGHADSETMQRAKVAEPFGYIVKPFEEFELQTTLETALKLHSAEVRLTQFSRAVEQSPASIVITDTTGRIEYVNPRFTELTGFTATEAIGQNPKMLKSGAQPKEYYRELWETITAGREWRGEFCNRKKNGDLYWELASISPVRDDAGRITHFLAVKEDITARKKAEDALLKSQAALRETNSQLAISAIRSRELALEAETANRAKSAFLTSMSHELRSPLNVINGMAATLAEQTSDAEGKSALNLIIESGENLLGIIEEILDYSGLQAGQPRIEPKSFELLGIVAQVLRMAGEVARRKQIDLGFSLAPGMPACVVSDPRRLQQVLLNLVSNAVKFTDRGRVHLHCSARPASAGRWRLCFAVSDTGSGISKAELARLFQPFARGSSPGVAQKSGSGLGLVISRTYARLLGGDIIVRSRPGRGSVFRCTIEAGDAGSRVTALGGIAPAGPKTRRALVVVDDNRQRRFLAGAIRAWNMPVTVLSGKNATGAALRNAGPVDFALVDPGVLRDPSSALVRWFAPGAPGYTVHVAWLHSFNPPPRPVTGGAYLNLAFPLDLGELARTLSNPDAGGPPAPAAEGAPARKTKLAERIPLRILAADDIRTNREMLRMMMGHLGYKLTLVENGAEVLAMMKQQPFDLILLDVQMPVMDGITAAREICLAQPDPSRRPKMVAITANALPGDREKCLAAGMDDYLSKPVLPRHIEVCFCRQFQKGAGVTHTDTVKAAAPVSKDPPLMDRTHLNTVMEGSTPAQVAETLAELQAATHDDFLRIWPEVVAACNDHDSTRLASLTHGLKGCFLTLGWMRISQRCIEVLGQARKGEFEKWATFPAELKCLFNASSAAMTDSIAALAPSASSAGNDPTTNGTGQSFQNVLMNANP